MAEKLEGASRDAALTELSAAGWSLVEERDAIMKDYKFKSFVEAFGWMTKVAIHAEALNHHPEWSNVYSRVSVVLTTHDANGLTDLDVALAKRMDAAIG